MKNGVSNRPWCLLGLALFLLLLGLDFRMAEDNWVDVEAVVSRYGGHELQFYKEEWEPLSTVLHLSPPAGEPDWQPGQKVAISYHRPGSGDTVLRADKPAAWSPWVLLSGLLLLIIAAPLAFVHSRRQRQATPPAAEEPELGCLLCFSLALLRWAGYLCCFLSALGLCSLITSLHYNPDPNAGFAVVLAAIPFWLLAGLVLVFGSRALRRKQGLSRE